ncbi:MAG: EamA family transporter [Candidatus Symbiobacter sp.]|nr:EamA family transporter [Candidatus Symbiobacter sp.]
MKIQDIGLAIMTTVIWGLSFVFIKVGLTAVPPLFLAFLRFGLAALPCLWLPRPRVGFWHMFFCAGFLFVGQFGLGFVGISRGLPAGLASVVVQSQVFFTIALMSILSRNIPHWRVWLGGAAGCAGLAMIGYSVSDVGCAELGGAFPVLGFMCSLGSGLAWAIGNVLLFRMGKVNVLANTVWMSLFASVPLLLLSYWFEGPSRIVAMIDDFDYLSLLSVLYIGIIATLLCYAIWGKLLQNYVPSVVAPFSLLVPVTGILATAVILGERLHPLEMIGVGTILSGLTIISLNLRRGHRPGPDTVARA